MTRLEVVGLGVCVGHRRLIDDLRLTVGSGRFVGLIGPNGSGKSTLLKTIYRVLRAECGSVSIGGQDVEEMAQKQVARRLAVVAQEAPPELELTVYEVVMLGRLPHQGVLATTSRRDRHAVDDALGRVGADHLADRSWPTLSGGEKQRVLLARALAQDADVLILDEPTNHLDVRHQLGLLALAKRLGPTILAALHDLNLAAEFCDEIVVLNEGAIVAHGAPADVLVDEVLAPVFGVRVDPVVHPRTGARRLLFSSVHPDDQSACSGDASPDRPRRLVPNP